MRIFHISSRIRRKNGTLITFQALHLPSSYSSFRRYFLKFKMAQFLERKSSQNHYVDLDKPGFDKKLRLNYILPAAPPHLILAKKAVLFKKNSIPPRTWREFFTKSLYRTETSASRLSPRFARVGEGGPL